MRPLTLIRFLVAGSITCSLFGACRDKVGSNLTQQLQSYYAITTMEANGLKVAKAGCTMAIQKEGLSANPSSKLLGAYANTYQDGQVVAGKTGIRGFLPGRDKLQSNNVRGLGVGEKAYLTKVDVQESGINFTIQTCGRCEVEAADPAHKPYRASVEVKFQKGYLGLTDLKHVTDTVNEILATDDGAAPASTDTQSTAPPAQQPPQQAMQPDTPAPAAQPQQAPPQNFAPISAPPPPVDEPPAKPVQIEKGQTIDQVTAALGQPQTILKADGRQIYLFKDFKITFVNGKVSEIDIR